MMLKGAPVDSNSLLVQMEEYYQARMPYTIHAVKLNHGHHVTFVSEPASVSTSHMNPKTCFLER